MVTSGIYNAKTLHPSRTWRRPAPSTTFKKGDNIVSKGDCGRCVQGWVRTQPEIVKRKP